MQFYLKYINPLLSILVLIICFYAGIVDEGNFKIEGIAEGGFKSYFIAKGIFCSACLYILGKILEVMYRNKSM